MAEQNSRIRRAKRTRCRIRELQQINPDLTRLTVHRTSKHTYAQVIKFDPSKRTSEVVAMASTLEKDLKTQCGKTMGNVSSAKIIGACVAKRALEKGIKKVAFDRSGYKYHGRIKALAEAAREAGLDF